MHSLYGMNDTEFKARNDTEFKARNDTEFKARMIQNLKLSNMS